MTNCMDRLRALGVTLKRAERIFEVPSDLLEQALETSPPPRWLLFCLDGLERALAPDGPLEEPSGSGSGPALEPTRDDVLALAGGDEKTDDERAAELIFPLLINAAKNQQFASYDALDAAFDVTGADGERYSRPLAILCENILTLSENSEYRIPPIAALAIVEPEGLPGDDLDEYMRIYLIETDRAGISMRMSTAREEIIRDYIFPDIFAFDHWDDVKKRIGTG
ncbi:hypothetical protein FACS1894205_6620 [Alphaproteobacteria bacterium]|nr:hypothetical protein FACS1894205_6620 [Alphaproteobacteria bacterium]